MDKLKVEVISSAPVERLIAHADFTAVFSWAIKFDGHSFYVFTLKNTNLTLAYDIEEKEWSQWTDKDGNYLPIVSSTFDGSKNHILQHESNGKLYYSDSSYFTDDGDIITVDIYTPNFDGGVRRTKQLNMLTIIADKVPGSMLQVRSSDDDYQTWSNFRSVDLSEDDPRLPQEGSFLRRAYNFRHQMATDFRLQAAELQVDIGTN